MGLPTMEITMTKKGITIEMLGRKRKYDYKKTLWNEIKAIFRFLVMR